MSWPAALAWTIRPLGIDEKHAGAQTIQRIGKGRRFGLFDIDRLADEQGTARVWTISAIRRAFPRRPYRLACSV